MTHVLADLLTERIALSLRRKTIVSASKWALEYRVMGKPFMGNWTFKRHPWLIAMHDSPYDVNIGQKAAQMGYTETALNIVHSFKLYVKQKYRFSQDLTNRKGK